MNELNNEIWTKWEILGEKNISHDMESIVYDKYGLVINLYGVEDASGQDIIIDFGIVIAYRLIDEYYKEADYQDLIKRNAFNGKWCSYIIKNSKWVDELTRPENIVLEKKEDYIHYAIIEEDYIIEVISTREPEIEFVSEESNREIK